VVGALVQNFAKILTLWLFGATNRLKKTLTGNQKKPELINYSFHLKYWYIFCIKCVFTCNIFCNGRASGLLT